MTEHQDPFLVICESLRLHELTRYTTDELIAELKRRDSDVGSDESTDSNTGARQERTP